MNDSDCECPLSILPNAYSTRSSRVSIDLLLGDDPNASWHLIKSRKSRRFHYLRCVRIGGTHLVLFGLHYWNKGISCAQPYGGFGIRRIKGIWRAVKNIMSTSFSEMVQSSCARASRATAAHFPRFCDYRSWLNYRLGASLIPPPKKNSKTQSSIPPAKKEF